MDKLHEDHVAKQNQQEKLNPDTEENVMEQLTNDTQENQGLKVARLEQEDNIQIAEETEKLTLDENCNVTKKPSIVKEKIQRKACGACSNMHKGCGPDCIFAPFFPREDNELYRVMSKGIGMKYLKQRLEATEEGRSEVFTTLYNQALSKIGPTDVNSYVEAQSTKQHAKTYKRQKLDGTKETGRNASKTVHENDVRDRPLSDDLLNTLQRGFVLIADDIDRTKRSLILITDDLNHTKKRVSGYLEIINEELYARNAQQSQQFKGFESAYQQSGANQRFPNKQPHQNVIVGESSYQQHRSDALFPLQMSHVTNAPQQQQKQLLTNALLDPINQQRQQQNQSDAWLTHPHMPDIINPPQQQQYQQLTNALVDPINQMPNSINTLHQHQSNAWLPRLYMSDTTNTPQQQQQHLTNAFLDPINQMPDPLQQQRQQYQLGTLGSASSIHQPINQISDPLQQQRPQHQLGTLGSGSSIHQPTTVFPIPGQSLAQQGVGPFNYQQDQLNLATEFGASNESTAKQTTEKGKGICYD